MQKGPIGVFDSGYGGLTVLKSLQESLPTHDFLYLGDNARTPYGSRSYDTIYEYTLEAVHYLFNAGCNLVILACNTASAKALRTIQQKDLPSIAPKKRVLGVIRPTAEIIGQITKSKNVGILGTMGTIKSESYILEINKQNLETSIHQQACPLWVPLIEAGETSSEGAQYFVKKYLSELFAKSPEIDTLLLACTHYPLLIDIIRQHVPPQINVLSQGPIVAKSLVDYLNRHPEIDQYCTKASTVDFLTTDDYLVFEEKAIQFLGEKVKAKKVHL